MRMTNCFLGLGLSLSVCLGGNALAMDTEGSTVHISASSELQVPNDEASLVFTVSEQDKDAKKAASLVSARMKSGIEQIKQQDKQAALKTTSYSTYPVYAETDKGQARQVTAWRVTQTLSVTTTNIDALPTTVAAAQKVLALNGVQFGLRVQTQKQQDAQLMQLAYQALEARVETMAKAIGQQPQQATLSTLQVDGDNYRAPMMMARSAMAIQQDSVAEPQFEVGQTTLSMRLSAEVLFGRKK